MRISRFLAIIAISAVVLPILWVIIRSYGQNEEHADKVLQPDNLVRESPSDERGEVANSEIVVRPVPPDAPKPEWPEDAEGQLTQFNFDVLLHDPLWKQAHGGDVSFDTYLGLYDEETLRGMARSGDHIAQFTLGILLTTEGRHGEAMQFHWEAAIGGVSVSLAHIGKIHLNSGNESVSPEALTEALAWSLVAEIRGDPSGLDVRGTIEQKTRVPKTGGENIREKACKIASDIYDQLTDERASRGLPLFDNRVPTKSVVDLSRLGNVCPEWPVARTSCSPAVLSEEYPYPIFHCRN